MLYREIIKILGNFYLCFSLFLIPPLLVSIYFKENIFPFLITGAISALFGGVLFLFCRKEKGFLNVREGLIVLIVIWLLTPAFGALPFLLSKTLDKPLQAYFEAVSGFTTTGNTVFAAKKYDARGEEIPYQNKYYTSDKYYIFYGTIDPKRDESGQIISSGIEAVPKSILFWRSLLQWLGGASIIIIFLGVLPLLEVGGKPLLHIEVRGILRETSKLRIKEIFLLTGIVYLGLTLFQILLLWTRVSNMSVFDAFTITCSTVSTGGFTTHSENIGYFQNIRVIRIIILFMMLSAINYSFYFSMIKGEVFRLWNMKLLIYFLIIIFSGWFAALYLVGTEKFLLNGESEGFYTHREALRHGVFQTVSALTTTGFATMNYDKWPYPVQMLMFVLTFIGGMSGSPAGGIKIIRCYILIRLTLDKILLFFRPTTIRPLRIGSHIVDSAEATTVFTFFFTAITFAVLGTFFLVMDGVDVETAMTLIASAQNNSGISFREAGPLSSCAFLSNAGLIVTSLWMIFGRLEFFAFLVIFIPSFWKK